ncbi:Type I inositol polyphosphate 5-phosphatase 10 [Linum perenne]
MPNRQTSEPFRIFVATWNVGGKSPHSGLNLDDVLQVHNQADIYVLGFQEIVPLNAGNVLGAEDSEPAAKWLALINLSLNKSYAVGSKAALGTRQMRYSLIVGKQMVGIFLTVWMKKELVQHVGHLRVSYISRGIMGCLGNKKEGDELRRNLDVIEILKNTQFPRICKSPYTNLPERIIQHDRIIWLGDLNYRIALNYSETRKLVERNDWNALFDKDQVHLKIEREKGRVFKGWKEGKIYFAPTYKYSWDSDIYAGETVDSKNKRRTPAWCDRILWHGDGMQQMSYVRKEYRFSDHRPVCATFLVDVEVVEIASRKASSAYRF